MNLAAPVAHAPVMLQGLLPIRQEQYWACSCEAASFGCPECRASSVPLLSVPLGMWGLEFVLSQATLYPIQHHCGGEAAPRGLAPRAPLWFLVSIPRCSPATGLGAPEAFPTSTAFNYVFCKSH